jgi:hypothetical protein
MIKRMILYKGDRGEKGGKLDTKCEGVGGVEGSCIRGEKRGLAP